MKTPKYLFIGNNIVIKSIINLFKRDNLDIYHYYNYNRDIVDESITNIIYCDYLGININKQSEMINQLFKIPLCLIRLCQKRKIHLTIMSEYSDINSPITCKNIINNYLYGINNLDNVLILKLNKLITKEYDHDNYLYKILNYQSLNDLKSSFSVLDEILPYSKILIVKKLVGQVNLVTPGTLSDREIRNIYEGKITNSNNNYKCFYNEINHQIIDPRKFLLLFPDLKDTRTCIIEAIYRMKQNIV